MTTERTLKIVELRKLGFSFAQIAEELGVSKGRVSEILENYNIRRKNESAVRGAWGEAADIFGTRIISSLRRAGVHDLDSLIKLVSEGGVYKKGSGWYSANGAQFRNVGDFAWLEKIFPHLESIGVNAEYKKPKPKTVDPQKMMMEWMPVTERLPEPFTPVLVTILYDLGHTIVDVSYFRGLPWMLHDEPAVVIAWMSLPPPFVSPTKTSQADRSAE